MGQFSKKFEDLTIADNFMFCKVMQNEEICRGVLEVLLGIKVERIDYLRTENPIENFYDARGVRLDVYVKDSSRVFNIEMQAGNYRDILLRARYYLSSSDVATTKRRTKFRDIKETFILFICKDDPFGEGLPRYTKETGFLETDAVSYDDKSHNVFYNCSAWQKEKDPEVQDVLKFIHGLKPDRELGCKMEKAVCAAKEKSYLEDEYMYFSDVLEEEKEEAHEIGLAEGREAGLAEGREVGLVEGRKVGLVEGRETGRELGLVEARRETAERLIQMNVLTAEQISTVTKLPLEEILQLAEQ
ncbi:MAG: Rpn family recombination-promoting nuclease/putative transposase [Treponema sp.]|nr:Rpn family recombination-promoting nuclease/putative transposase [Treponema sp.]